MQEFKISVIIPVFNAAIYLPTAVKSALMQPEVAEILLIEDGSKDNSMAVCQMLVKEFSTIKLLCHQNHVNRGAAASRNLGIKNALCEFVAFLDADDFYLPNRFNVEKILFSGNHNIDGIYSYVKAEFKNEELRQKYLLRHSEHETFTEKVEPEKLLFYLLFGGKGTFHIDGVTVRKSAFKKIGLFDSSLRLAEDTELWLRLAAVCELHPGNIETPIAIRTVHDNNTIHTSNEVIDYYNSLLYSKLMAWAINQRQLGFQKVNWFFMAYHRSLAQGNSGSLRLLVKLAKQHPSFLLHFFLYRKGFSILKSGFKKLTKIHFNTTSS